MEQRDYWASGLALTCTLRLGTLKLEVSLAYYDPRLMGSKIM
jgi:hypothetical protein